MNRQTSRKPLISAGLVLGIGLGGFIDGILLHQVLQWHHMVSSAGYPPTTVTNLEVNTLWDGLFHLFAWVMTVTGVALLWRAAGSMSTPRSGRTLAGSLLAGWGLFNLVEGLVDHQILGIHHVREVPNFLAWDLAYLAFGVALVAAGWALMRSAPPRLAIVTTSDGHQRVAG